MATVLCLPVPESGVLISWALSQNSPGSICRALKEQVWPRHLKIWLIKAQGGLESYFVPQTHNQDLLWPPGGSSNYIESLQLLQVPLRHLRGAQRLDQLLCWGERRLRSKGRPIWLIKYLLRANLCPQESLCGLGPYLNAVSPPGYIC